MIHSARRRHALIWLALAPAILLGLAVALANRPPEAISDGPKPLVEDRIGDENNSIADTESEVHP